MPASSSSGDPNGSAIPTSASGGSTLPHASGELVHEQTVRAPIPGPPAACETTVRVPVPTLPQEQTVRAFVPSAVPRGAASALEVEELEEVDVEPEVEVEVEPGMEAIDAKPIDVGALVSELEAHARGAKRDIDVPVSRAEQVTVPEAAAKIAELLAADKRAPRARGKRPRPDGPPPRPEPPAVSGEVSVSEPDPGGLFGAAPPRREDRVRTPTPARSSMPRRDEPPAVSGEVAIDSASAASPEVQAGDIRVMPMTSSGAQPVMTSSGSHPIMTGSGAHPIMTGSGASPVIPRRAGTDPGYLGKDSTGPQPRGQSETTGPHPVVMPMRRRRGESSSRDSLVLWVLAGALVVLALGVVMMVISWAQ